MIWHHLRFNQRVTQKILDLVDSIGCALVGLGVDKGKVSVGLIRRSDGSPEVSILGIGDVDMFTANTGFVGLASRLMGGKQS